MASIHTTTKSKHPVTREPGNPRVSHYRGVSLFNNTSAPAERRWTTTMPAENGPVQGERIYAATRTALLTQIDTLLDNPQEQP